MSKHTKADFANATGVPEETRRRNPLIYGPTAAAKDSSWSESALRTVFSEPKPKTASAVRTPSAIPTPATKREKNQTEAEFEERLKLQYPGAKIRWEGIRLKWGGGMHYKPDLLVFREGMKPILYEVKGGHMWDRDRVRFLGCKAEWPEFDFELWQKKGGEWSQKY